MVSGEALIYVRNRRNPKYNGIYGRVARYAAIHHNSPAGKEFFMRGPILSGDAKWMFTVQREARKRFGARLRGHIQKFIKEGKSGPIEQWLPAWDRRVKKLEERTVSEPAEVARWGVDLARKIAPKSTKSLISAIDWKKNKR